MRRNVRARTSTHASKCVQHVLFEPNELSPRVQERRGPLRGREEKEGRGKGDDGEKKGAVGVGAEEWGLSERSSGRGKGPGGTGRKREGSTERAEDRGVWAAEGGRRPGISKE